MIHYLKQNRVYRSYFGGKRLDKLCGKEVWADTQFPEAWIASTVRAFNVGREDIDEGLSVCDNGKLLRDIISENPKMFLGEEQFNKHGENMSILVKLLDSAERLFIQCHPTVPFAKKYFNSNFGKTECWYIISAEKNACVYLGFKPEITRQKWQKYFDNQDIDSMLSLMHKISVSPGDLIFVEGGVPHAIGEGCLLCELQEPTDYMVIPERTSKSGITLSDKKMHGGLGFERMMDCFVYEGFSEEKLRKKYIRHPILKDNQLVPIVDCSLTDKFKMDCLKLNGSCVVNFDDTYAVCVVTDGMCTVCSDGKTNEIKSGSSFIVSADNKKITFDGNATLMICRP